MTAGVTRRVLVPALAAAALVAAAAGAAARGRAPARGASAAPNTPAGAARAALPAGASAAAARVVAGYTRDLGALDAAAEALGAAAASGTPDGARAAFRRARLAYKRAEALAEFYTPQTARAVNGPAIDRAEEDAPSTVLPATGFQVAEAALFPDTAAGWRAAVREQAALLRSRAATFREDPTTAAPTDAHVFDALRAEVARVGTLGVAGFDASLSGDGLRESAEALRGVRAALLAYPGPAAAAPARDAAAARLAAAAAYLDAHPDAERMDRLAFLTGQLTPAARALDAARRAAGVALPPDGRVWARAAASPYEAGAFAAAAYAPPYAPAATPALVALGAALFADPALSGDGARSCASCHQPAHGFADGRARRLGRDGAHDASGRNTPTVLNVGLQPNSFYDQRTTYLEDQVTDVMRNRAEMRHAVDAAAGALGQRPGYRAAFARAFAAGPTNGDSADGDSVVTAERLRLALAAYLRSLQTLDAPFDRAVHGDTAALTPAARRGFTVFMGKGKCGTCHFAPLFNGVTPPGYTEAEPEVIGVPAVAPARLGGRPARLDPDVGRFAVDHIALHRHAFKTPTLRNVALTAPYMHNGAYRTLAEVVDFYDGGGGAGMGLRVPNQTLPADSLRLTRAEKRDLLAFLDALTDCRSPAPACRPNPTRAVTSAATSPARTPGR